MIGNLPDQWARVPLGACLRRRQDTVLPSTIDADSVNVVGLEDIEAGGRGGIAIKRMRPTDAESLKTRFCRGDILYGKLRPYLNKVGIAPDDGLCGTEIWAFAAEDFVDPFFAYAFLSSACFVDRVSGMTKGANLPRLDLDAFATVEIPVPPSSEQHRITAILREMRAVSELRATAWTATRALLPALFFDRFSRHRQQAFAPLADMADVVSGVALGRQIRGAGVREVPYIRVANVQAGHLDLSEVKETKASESEIEAYALRAGDILLTEGGDFDKLGRGCLWMGEVEPCIHQNHIFRVRPDPERLNSHFFTQYLQSAAAKQYFLRCAKRTTNLASINLTQLKKLPVPVVSLAEQERFSQEVDEVLKCAEIDGGEISARLVASLQSHAFTGQLTSAWRARHSSDLSLEARARDAALNLVGVVRPDGSGGQTDAVTPMPVVPLAYTDLSRDQRQVLECIAGTRRHSGDDGSRLGSEAAGFTAADIATALTGPLHNNTHAVEANLAVLAARGLVVALSRAQRAPDTDETVYGNCCRLATADPYGDRAEDGEPAAGGVDLRDQEIRRVLGLPPAAESEPWGCAGCICPTARPCGTWASALARRRCSTGGRRRTRPSAREPSTSWSGSTAPASPPCCGPSTAACAPWARAGRRRCP